MKKVLITLFVLFSIVMAGQAMATLYTETFLGTSGDSSYFNVNYEGWYATFNFNLTAAGDQAYLYNSSGVLQNSVNPSTDVSNFNPTTTTVTDASLQFVISDNRDDYETVRVSAGLYDGSTQLSQVTYDLGGWSWDDWSYTRQYATLNIDLGDLGLLNYLADGKFVTVVLAVNLPGTSDNDFRIDTASLTVDGCPTNVPEPSTMLLLGVGLIGFGIARKKSGV